MIFVDRARVPQPEWFGSAAWGQAQYKLLNHFTAAASVRSQRRAASIAGPWPKEVDRAVWSLFEGRCAICESAKVKSDGSCVKQFRPIETEEALDRYAHAYAALLWENLILLCPNCDRARGDRFLLDGGSEQTNERLREISFDLGKNFASLRAYQLLESELARARSTERPLQIDPTLEQPAKFLVFESSGRVWPVGKSERRQPVDPFAFHRADHTIEIFQLNRSDLLSRRHFANQRITSALGLSRMPKSEAGVQAASKTLNGWFSKLRPALDMLPGEFQASKSLEVVRWLERRIDAPLSDVVRFLKWPRRERQDFRRLVLPVWEAWIANTSRKRPRARPIRARRRPTISTTAPQFSRQRITRVRLKNFRHFREAAFKLPLERPEDAFGPDRQLAAMIRRAGLADSDPLPEPEAYCGWKMLLGENGVGKSSVLQAIALALLGDEAGTKAIAAVIDLRRSLSQDATRGSIEVWLEGRDKPIRIGFSNKRVSITGIDSSEEGQPSRPKPILFLRGYGATRLLPPPRDSTATNISAAPSSASQQVGNLFNPHFPLADPTDWLQALDDEARRLAFITLKDLLDLPARSSLVFQDWHGVDTFGLIQAGRFIPLEFFSAGYQSIVALGCDIMAGFGKSIGDMQKRAGVVLLDEIGTNLHPRWRLRIVQALRRAFPLLQFVVSTHEPLCLRGLGNGEVALLTLEGSPPTDANESQGPEKPAAVVLRDDLPSPAIYRVDQLLTGDFFGLHTAYDPDEEAAFDAYHALLVKERVMAAEGALLPPEHAALLERLRARLKDRINLGDTVAERQVMAALETAEIEKSEKPGHREPLKGSPAAKAAATRLLQQLSPNLPP